MQVLVWTVSDLHHAVPTSRTVEVIPLVRARPIPRSPATIRGLINFRGQLIELIDMGALLAGQPVEPRMACRILVVDAEDTQACLTAAAASRAVAGDSALGVAKTAGSTASGVTDDRGIEASRSAAEPTLSAQPENGSVGKRVGLLVKSLVGLADIDFTQSPPAETLDCLGPIAVSDSTTIQLLRVERLAESRVEP